MNSASFSLASMSSWTINPGNLISVVFISLEALMSAWAKSSIKSSGFIKKVGGPPKGTPIFGLGNGENSVRKGAELLVVVVKIASKGVGCEIPKVPVDVVHPVEVAEATHAATAIEDASTHC